MLELKTKDDLVALIAAAIRRQVSWMDDRDATAIADTILRTMKAAGLRISRRQHND